MQPEVLNFLIALGFGIAMVVLGGIGGAIVMVIKREGNEAFDDLRVNNPALWDMLVTIVELMVKAAAQARLNGWIADSGEAAKAYVMERVKAWLQSVGVDPNVIDWAAIDALVEGTYLDLSEWLREQMEKREL